MPNLTSMDAVSRVRVFISGSPKTAAALAVGGFLGAVLVVHLVLALTGQQSGLWLLRDLLRGQLASGTDSWNVMILARDWLEANPGADGDLYREIFFEQKHKFQYAPTSFLSLDVFRLFGTVPTIEFLNLVNRIVLLIAVAGMGVLCWLVPERLSAAPLDADGRRARLLMALAAPAGALLFFPLLYGEVLGQLQVWISALFVAACIAWVTGRRIAAGVLIGLICLLKPQFGLFAVWGLLRKEWQFTGALAATGAAGLVISVLLYGFGNHLAYLEVLSYISRHGEAFWANQSANGLLQRIFGNGNSAVFEAQSFPPFHAGVYGGTLLVTVALLFSVFALRRRAGAAVPLYDFMLAALIFTVASPVAWEHHYGVLMPIFAVLATGWVCSAPRPGLWKQGAALSVAFLFAAVPLWGLTSMTGLIHIAQSHLYFAALVVVIVLWRLTADGWSVNFRKVRAG